MHSFEQHCIFVLPLLSSYVTRNSKSTNSQRFYCQSFTLLCSVWHCSCTFSSGGDVPLETPPPFRRCSISTNWQRVPEASDRILPKISREKTKVLMFYDQKRASFKLSFIVFDLSKREQACAPVSILPHCAGEIFTLEHLNEKNLLLLLLFRKMNFKQISTMVGPAYILD